jgi:hypothetical protein
MAIYPSFPLTASAPLDNIPGQKVSGSDANLQNGFINPGTTYTTTSPFPPFVNGQAVVLTAYNDDAGYPVVDAITSDGTTLSTQRVDAIIAYDQRTGSFYANDPVALFMLSNGERPKLKAGVAFTAGDPVYWDAQNQYATNTVVANVTTACIGKALASSVASTPDNIVTVPVQLQPATNTPVL